MTDHMHENIDDEPVTRRECYLLRNAMENRIGGFESQMVEVKTELRLVKEVIDGIRGEMTKEREERIKFQAEVMGAVSEVGKSLGSFETMMYRRLSWVLILLLVTTGGIVLGRAIDFSAIGAALP